MAPKKSEKKGRVKTSKVLDVSRGSDEKFKTGLSSEEGENAVLSQPEITSAPTKGKHNEVVKQEKKSQESGEEALVNEDEQVQTTEEPSQQQNGTQLKQKEPQKNDKEKVQETPKESSLSPLQCSEDTNEVAQRSDVGKPADDEGEKRKSETRQMDEDPVENIEVEQETSKDSTLVHQSTEVISPPDQEREADKQENVQSERIIPSTLENIEVEQETSKDSTLVHQSTEVISPPDQEREADKQENVQSEPISPSTLMMHHLVAVLLLIFMVILLFPPEPAKKADPDLRLELATSLKDKVIELKSLFSNQTDSFWKAFRITSFMQLKNPNPRQPLVFSVLVPPSARDVVDCFVKKLAELINPNKTDFIMIDGLKEMNKPGEMVMKKINVLLTKKFEAGHKVALVNHLELFPPPSHMMFFPFCDDQNAPYKKVAIIFTVYLPKEPAFSLSSNKEAETALHQYLLNEVWANVAEPGTTASLIVRVGPVVLFMNGESSDSVKNACR